MYLIFYLICILLILYIYYDTQTTVHLHSAAIYRSVLAPAAAQAIVNFWFVSWLRAAITYLTKFASLLLAIVAYFFEGTVKSEFMTHHALPVIMLTFFKQISVIPNKIMLVLLQTECS